MRFIHKIKSSVFSLLSIIYLNSPLNSTLKTGDAIAFVPTYLNGNTKTIFESMLTDSRYNKFHLYLVVHSIEDYNRLKNTGTHVCYAMDPTKIKLFSETKVWITDHGPGKIPFYWLYKRGWVTLDKLKGDSLWVDTWHGIGFKTHTKEGYGHALSMYDIQFVTSEFFRDVYINKFGFRADQLYITGYPRNDMFFNKTELEEAEHSKINILYAPTYENVPDSNHLFPWDLKTTLDEIEIVCEKYNCSFYLRPHPLSKLNTAGLVAGYEHIKVTDVHNCPDTQTILLHSDVLITDWSSICFDFLLLNRPMIFIDNKIPYDDYTMSPSDRCGYIVNSLDGFSSAMVSAIAEKKVINQEKRERVLSKCYKYLDSDASQRCTDIIYNKLF